MTLYKEIILAALELSVLYMNTRIKERKICKVTAEISDQNTQFPIA
jgi:hypothetical protein